MDKNGIRILLKEVAKEVVLPLSEDQKERIAQAMDHFRRADRLLASIQEIVDQAQLFWTEGYACLRSSARDAGDLTFYLSAESALQYVRGRQIRLPEITVKSPYDDKLENLNSMSEADQVLDTGHKLRRYAIQVMLEELEHGVLGIQRDFDSLTGTLMYLTDLYPLARNKSALFLAGCFAKEILQWGATKLRVEKISDNALQAITKWDVAVAKDRPSPKALLEAAQFTTDVLEKLNAEDAP